MLLDLFSFYLHECFACMYVSEPACACLVPRRPEEGIRSPGTWITDGCGWWELNSGNLQEQVPLTAEPALQLLVHKVIFLVLVWFGVYVRLCVGKKSMSVTLFRQGLSTELTDWLDCHSWAQGSSCLCFPDLRLGMRQVLQVHTSTSGLSLCMLKSELKTSCL